MNRDSSHKKRSSSGGPATPLRDRLRQATIDAILTATEVELAESGVHGAGMTGIAARAGVAVGTLYNHFADREELVRALFDARRAALFSRIDAAYRVAAAQPFHVQLTAFVRAIFEHFDEHRPFLRILFETEFRPPGTPARRAPHEQMVERAERMLHRGVTDGELRPELVEMYPGALMGIMKATLLRLLPLADRRFADETDRVVAFFLRGAGA